MKTRHVVFFGDQKDESGMPTPFHHYVLFGGDWEPTGFGIATIFGVTEGADVPKQSLFAVTQGGANAALDSAESALKKLSGNQGLKTRRE